MIFMRNLQVIQEHLSGLNECIRFGRRLQFRKRQIARCGETIQGDQYPALNTDKNIRSAAPVAEESDGEASDAGVGTERRPAGGAECQGWPLGRCVAATGAA